MWRVKIFGLLYLFKVFKKNIRQSLTAMSWVLKVKYALMSKQINFYATEVDKKFLEELLKGVFGEMLDVPSPQGPLAPFPPVLYNSSSFYLVEMSRKEDLVYYTHAYYTGKIISVLDTVNGPVLEYSPAGVNATEGYYLQGRFYTRAKDKEFLRKVSVFMARMKRRFFHVKKYNLYLSPDIDAQISRFSCDRIITKDDLS